MNVAEVAAKLVAETPEGWIVESGLGSYDTEYEGAWPGSEKKDRRFLRFVFSTNDKIVVVLNVSAKQEYIESWHGVTVEGDTLVDGRSYTRRGIDCHCCLLVDVADRLAAQYENEYATLVDLLAGQKARCERTLVHQKTAVAVPGLPFTVQPDWFSKSAAELKAGRRVTLAPRGFGTGYVLSMKRVVRGIGGSSRRVKPELEALLGVEPVFFETYDHD